jgi:GTP-dependent phosphoenolpyruvate carboxykinase
MAELLEVDPADWVEAVQGQEELIRMFGDRMPKALRQEHDELAHRIQRCDHPGRSDRARFRY